MMHNFNVLSRYSFESATIYKTIWTFVNFNMSSHDTTYNNYYSAIFMMIIVKPGNQNI